MKPADKTTEIKRDASSISVPYEEGQRGLFCRLCRVEFDNLPDEGGDLFNDPTRPLELADGQVKRKRQGAVARAALPPGFRRTRQ